MQSWVYDDLRVQNQWVIWVDFKSFIKSFTRPQFVCKVGRMNTLETSHIKKKDNNPNWHCLFFTFSTDLKRIWFHQIKSVIGNGKSQIFLLWLGFSPLQIKSLLWLGLSDCQIGVDTHLCWVDSQIDLALCGTGFWFKWCSNYGGIGMKKKYWPDHPNS